MSTNKKHNRSHGLKNKRAFPDQHPGVRLANCFYIIDDTQWTHDAKVAIAAQNDGRAVKVNPQLRAIGRAVPPDEEWATDPPQQTPSN